MSASQFRSNAAHTGVYSGPAVAEPAKTRWKYDMGERWAVRPPARFDGAWVVAPRRGGLDVVDAAKGKLLYSVALGTGGGYAGPAVIDGVAYAVDYDPASGQGAELFAVDLAARDVRWRFPAGKNGRSSPTIAAGSVYLGDDSGVFALDAATGSERWRYTTPDEAPVFCPVTVVGDLALFSTSGPGGVRTGSTYALELSTGALRWSVPSGPTDWMGALASDGETVFVTTGYGAELRALSLADGAQRWSATMPGGAWAAPAVSDGVVFAGSYDGVLHAIDALNGEERWREQVAKKGFSAGPAVLDGVVFAGVGKTLRAYGLDGALRWERKTPKDVSCAPVIADGQLVVGCSDFLAAF